MIDAFPADYLAGLPEGAQQTLAQVNGPGLAALRECLRSGEAVAFLGAGASAPLYPLWPALIAQLVEEASGRLNEEEAATCRRLAKESPEEVVEILRQLLGASGYREVLRESLRVRTDSESGRSWTPLHELVCRCSFKAVVTTNYDPGIVDARMRVRVGASGTGFTSWTDELGLDRWRTGDVFGESELPVLFAHGQHAQPDSVVLATTEYRRAYEGKLPHVLGRLVDGGHLVWIGFSFADQRIAAILREIANNSGTRVEPGTAPRHVAIMPWDSTLTGNDPKILARRAEIGYGARIVLYPVIDDDHSALATLLSELTDPKYPPAPELSAHSDLIGLPPHAQRHISRRERPVTWATGVELVDNFTGRAEELARLDRWAGDPHVGLVGVTAWGGAGKTALVSHWVQQMSERPRLPHIAGAFAWSFYADPAAESWAAGLRRWALDNFAAELPIRAQLAKRAPAAAVFDILQSIPLLLVLDGLEVMQEGPAGEGFGRLLDGTLREVLTSACQVNHAGLIVLTSRFPFADLESFDGSSARMLELPSFTPSEGAALVAAAGGGWLGEAERRDLVQAVDGHALAVGVLAGILADRPPAGDLAELRNELANAARTSTRVGRVLRFYSERLSEQDRYLVAAISLFARPVSAEAVLTITQHESFSGNLDAWTTKSVENAVRDRLGGLVSLHPDGTISAHPLVRDTFRPLAMGAAQVAADTALTGVPAGTLSSRTDALRVVEAVELLLDADQWSPADGILSGRTGSPSVWLTLPAARLGQRASAAFVANRSRYDACKEKLGINRRGFYLNNAGLYAMLSGDSFAAREYLNLSVADCREAKLVGSLSIRLRNLAECLGYLGEITTAQAAAEEALSVAQTLNNRQATLTSHAFLGWIAGLKGDSDEAERQFMKADRIGFAADPEHAHLYSRRGIWWAEWLARTGRYSSAKDLTERNVVICDKQGWHDDVGRCDQMLGRLALVAGEVAEAGRHLKAAVECFRDGDYLIELAAALTDTAECARVKDDLDTAERHVIEAITIAAPRGLIPAQSCALAVRARISADQASAASGSDHLFQGRDAADAALRLASRHHLAWCELDALRAHAALDLAQGTDHGWSAKADAQQARLIPATLPPDPLASIEQPSAEGTAPAD
ncbi:MAG TPA: SIR2 family protein [Trebonia sp.]